MITVRRNGEREHHLRGKWEGWLTFPEPGDSEPFIGGFGGLELLNEERLMPGASVPAQPQNDAQVVTYVREGAVSYRDSTGLSGVIHAGEFQRRIEVRGARHTETNASRADAAHLFQIRLRASQAGLEPTEERKRFSAAERRGRLCVVAAPDAQRGALRIQANARVYSALLDLGQHVVHELSAGHKAWLHLVQGEASVGDHVLTTGDGAGITGERAVSFTAGKETELLLLDLE
jgi:redox-sensitive bicupin YhaK (pirin superfamily)